jgi:hypothetical protein
MSKAKFPKTIIVTQYADGDEELCIDGQGGAGEVELGNQGSCDAAVYMLVSEGKVVGSKKTFVVSPPKGDLSLVH